MMHTLPPAGAHDGCRPVSRAELAAALGISERHLYRLLAAERAGVADWTPPPPDGPPHVPMGHGPGRGRYHYDLDDDGASRLPMGLMRIGEGPVAIADGGLSHRAGRPGRLEGRLCVRHHNEQLGDPPHVKDPPPKPPPVFRPKKPPRKKDRPA